MSPCFTMIPLDDTPELIPTNILLMILKLNSVTLLYKLNMVKVIR